MVIDLNSSDYENLQRPTEQSGTFTCDHAGECRASCPCRLNKTTCREACKCPSDCPHRFPYCGCEGSCANGTCVCIDHGRECVPGKCRRGRCARTPSRCSSMYPEKPLKSLRVSKSDIPGAGNGLFTCEDIRPHQCLGRYKGDILPDTVIANDGAATAMTAFAIAKDMSIQGIDPGNWLYWANHPDPGKEANAVFKTIEGPKERFIVLVPKKRIPKNTEILANYGLEFDGFADVSKKKGDDSQKQTSDTDDYSVGEYVLIYGAEGKNRHAQGWVGKIAKKYEGNHYGIHWLYHHSHLPQVPGLKLPKVLTEKTPSFDPWELIISEHGEVIEKDMIMSRVEMIERAGAGKPKKVGTWWWNWVIRYHRQFNLITNETKNVPFIIESSRYFKKKKGLADWDIVIRAQQMGLRPIEPIKSEKKVSLKRTKIPKEEKHAFKNKMNESIRSSTPAKERARIVEETEDEGQDTTKPKRRRKWQIAETKTGTTTTPSVPYILRSRERARAVEPEVSDDDDEDIQDFQDFLRRAEAAKQEAARQAASRHEDYNEEIDLVDSGGSDIQWRNSVDGEGDSDGNGNDDGDGDSHTPREPLSSTNYVLDGSFQTPAVTTAATTNFGLDVFATCTSTSEILASSRLAAHSTMAGTQQYSTR